MRANASEKLGALRPRERAKLEYNEALKEKFSAHPQVKRIAKHRHVPKGVFNANKKYLIMRNKEIRKEHNRRVHSAPGAVPFVSEKAGESKTCSHVRNSFINFLKLIK